jgi:hypothetical protein
VRRHYLFCFIINDDTVGLVSVVAYLPLKAKIGLICVNMLVELMVVYIFPFWVLESITVLLQVGMEAVLHS